MSPIVITLSLPDGFVERLGNPDPATLERQVLEGHCQVNLGWCQTARWAKLAG